MTEVTTPGGEGTGLDWTWNWTWLWDCESSGIPLPPDAIDTGGDTAPTTEQLPQQAPQPSSVESATPASDSSSNQPADGASPSGGRAAPTFLFPWAGFTTTASLLPWWTPSAIPSVEVAVEVPVVEVQIPAVAGPVKPTRGSPAVIVAATIGPVEVLVEVGLLPPVPSTTTATTPAAPSAWGAPLPDAPAASAPKPATGTHAQPRATRAGWEQGYESAPSLERSHPTAVASGESTPDRHRRSPLPFSFPTSSQGAGSPGSGGSTPSLLLFGFATIIGFFVFAAPGLGRRIRLARLPSPRSRYDSPLDRPG